MPGEMVGMGGPNTPADPDYGDSVSVAGTMGSKSDFDCRKKKRYMDATDWNVLLNSIIIATIVLQS